MDLSTAGNAVYFEFHDVPNGYYYINGFVDDVTNATDENPYPGIGDLVSFCNAGPKCDMVKVNGEDATDGLYIFNMVMPFDLPGGN